MIMVATLLLFLVVVVSLDSAEPDHR